MHILTRQAALDVVEVPQHFYLPELPNSEAQVV